MYKRPNADSAPLKTKPEPKADLTPSAKAIRKNEIALNGILHKGQKPEPSPQLKGEQAEALPEDNLPIELATANQSTTTLSDAGQLVSGHPGGANVVSEGQTGPSAMTFSPVTGAVSLGAIALAGSGGGGGSPSTPSTAPVATPQATQITGVVIDGYIRGATVYLDEDNDGVRDEGERFTMTDNNGEYTLEVPLNATGVVRATGGVNINPDGSDGAPNTALLSAPLILGDDSRVSLNITPITALIDALTQTEAGLSATEAAEQLAKSLGLTNIDLLTFDPIKAELEGTDDTTRSQGLMLNKLAAQVVALGNSVTNALVNNPDEEREGLLAIASLAVASQVVNALLGRDDSSIDSLNTVLSEEALNSLVSAAIDSVVNHPSLATVLEGTDSAQAKSLAQAAAAAQVNAIDKANSTQAIAAQQVAASTNKAPVSGGSKTLSIAENTKALGIFSASDADDGDTLRYSVTGKDAGLFDINTGTGEIAFKQAPDFETNNGRVFEVTVMATDRNGASSTQSLSIQVTDVNENAELDTLQTLIDGLKAELAALGKTAADKDTSIAGLRTDLNTVKADAESKQKALAEEADKLKLEIETLSKSAKTKDEDLAKLLTELNGLTTKLEVTVKEAEAKQKVLEEKIASLDATAKVKDSEISNLKADLDKTKKEAEAKQKGLETDISTMKGLIETLTASGKAKDEDIAKLKTDLSGLTTKLESTVKDAEAKQKSLEEKITSLDSAAKVKDLEISNLKADLDKTKKEAEAKQKGLETDISTMKGLIETLTASGKAKDEDIAKLKTELSGITAKLESTVKDAEAKQKALDEKIASLDAAAKSKDEEIAGLKATLSKAQSESASQQTTLTAEIAALKAKLADTDGLPELALPALPEGSTFSLTLTATKAAEKSVALAVSNGEELSKTVVAETLTVNAQPSEEGVDSTVDLTITGTQTVKVSYDLVQGQWKTVDTVIQTAEAAQSVTVNVDNDASDFIDVLAMSASIDLGKGLDKVVVRDVPANLATSQSGDQVMTILFGSNESAGDQDVVELKGYSLSDFLQPVVSTNGSGDVKVMLETTANSPRGHDIIEISNAERFVFAEGNYVLQEQSLVKEIEMVMTPQANV